MTIPRDGNYISLKRFLPEYNFDKISLKIDRSVVCLSFAVKMARFCDVNTDEFDCVLSFTSSMMLCAKHILVHI